MTPLEELERLYETIRACKKCPLHRVRRNPVPGEGPVTAKLMFVGEAPGEKEDMTGRPFVGAAGKLLTNLLESRGISRSEVYITNVLKCRPPGNRDPAPEEVEACTPYLIQQIKIIRPRMIVALGRHAASFLMSRAGIRFTSIGRHRGKPLVVDIEGVPVTMIVTYHPAAALYNPKLRGELERDFDLIASTYRGLQGEGRRRLTLDDFFKPP